MRAHGSSTRERNTSKAAFEWLGAARREADEDGDGFLSLDDFVRLVQLNKADSLSNFEDRLSRARAAEKLAV